MGGEPQVPGLREEYLVLSVPGIRKENDGHPVSGERGERERTLPDLVHARTYLVGEAGALELRKRKENKRARRPLLRTDLTAALS